MKIYTIFDKAEFCPSKTCSVILFGLKKNNLLDKELFKNVLYTENIHLCDIIVYPCKFDITKFKLGIYHEDEIFMKLDTLSKTYKKPLWLFHDGDADDRLNIDNNMVLFRTSFYKSLKQHNEYALAPCFYPDSFKSKFTDNISIGFCGDKNHGREKYLDILSSSNIKTDFILRKGHFAPEILDKTVAVKEYIKNMENNIFNFCYRGGGNFSYRFYHTFMMGRIPILLDTDCVLPFEHIIKNENTGLFICEKEIINKSINLIEEINKYIYKYKDYLIEIQKNNRKIWEEYLSPSGFIKKITDNFENYN